MAMRKTRKFSGFAARTLAFCMSTSALVSASAFPAFAESESETASSAETVLPLRAASYLTQRAALHGMLDAATGRARIEAAHMTADFYIERGLYPEAALELDRALKPGDSALADSALQEKLTLISLIASHGRSRGAWAYAEAASAPSPLERLITAALKGETVPPEGLSSRKALASLEGLFAFPATAQEELAPLLAEAAASGSDGDFLRHFATLFAQRAPALLPTTCQQWISARLAEYEGFPQAARARYARLSLTADRCAAHGRLRLALLDLMTGTKAHKTVRADMMALQEAWKGDTIEEGALRALALIDREEEDPRAALRWLRLLADRFPASLDDPGLSQSAARLAARLFGGLAEGQETNLHHWRRDRLAYLGFLKDDAIRRQEAESYAGALLAAGAHDKAGAILAGLIREIEKEAPGTPRHQALIVKKAETDLAADDAEAALAALAALPDAVDTGLAHEVTGAKLAALIALGRLDEANVELGAALTPAQALQLAQAYGKSADWEQAFHLLKAPIAEAGEGAREAVLPGGYYDLFAAAALLSGHEAEAARLLGKDKKNEARPPLAAMAAIPGTPLPEELTAPEKVRRLLDETGKLIHLADTL